MAHSSGGMVFSWGVAMAVNRRWRQCKTDKTTQDITGQEEEEGHSPRMGNNDDHNNNTATASSQQRSETKEAVKDILAGTIRGAAQTAVGQPLDLVKVRLQTQGTFNGVWDCLRKTWTNEGLLGFYKGAQSPLVMAGAYSAVLFFAYGQSKRLVLKSHENEMNIQPLQMAQIGGTDWNNSRI